MHSLPYFNDMSRSRTATEPLASIVWRLVEEAASTTQRLSGSFGDISIVFSKKEAILDFMIAVYYYLILLDIK